MSDTEQLSRVLVVDDEHIVRVAWRAMLAGHGFAVEEVDSAEKATARLAEDPADVVITDVQMSGMSGLDLLKHVKQSAPGTEVIVMTGYGTVPDAVEAIRIGAFDYLTKPFDDIEKCINRVRQAARLKKLHDELASLQVDPDRIDILRTRSPRMRRVIQQIKRVAPKSATVLIIGPTGAGKTAIARAIHQLSARREAEFVYVDCGLTPELIESKLFGHTKGAFTNAVTEREGLFKLADGGTIFLDEVGNMPADGQAKLLRVLNDGCFKPLGATRDVKVDVRVISATNDDLAERVQEGSFRADLYQRLKVIELQLPALNDRREDVPLLAISIVRRLARRHDSPVRDIAPSCMEALLAYDWTEGNIRELEHVLEHAVVFATGEELGPDALPPRIRGEALVLAAPESVEGLVDPNTPWHETVPQAVAVVRASYLDQVLRMHEGNIAAAARHAGLDRANFKKKLHRDLPDYKERIERLK